MHLCVSKCLVKGVHAWAWIPSLPAWAWVGYSMYWPGYTLYWPGSGLGTLCTLVELWPLGSEEVCVRCVWRMWWLKANRLCFALTAVCGKYLPLKMCEVWDVLPSTQQLYIWLHRHTCAAPSGVCSTHSNIPATLVSSIVQTGDCIQLVHNLGNLLYKVMEIFYSFTHNKISHQWHTGWVIS